MNYPDIGVSRKGIETRRESQSQVGLLLQRNASDDGSAHRYLSGVSAWHWQMLWLFKCCHPRERGLQEICMDFRTRAEPFSCSVG